MLKGVNVAVLALVLIIFIVVSMLWAPPPIEKSITTTTFIAPIIGSTTPRIPGHGERVTTTTGLPTGKDNVSIPWILKVKLPKVRPKVGFLQALIDRIKGFFAWLSSLFTPPPGQPRNTTTSSNNEGNFLLPATIIASATLAILGAYVIVIRRKALKGRSVVVIRRRMRRGGMEENKELRGLGIGSTENELVKAIKVLATRLGKVTGRKPDVITHREVLQLVKKHWSELSEDLKASAVNAVRYYELWRFAGKELREEWLEEARRVMSAGGGNEPAA